MKLLFKLSEEQNGTEEVLCRWRPEGNYLAVAGSNSYIRIYDKSGNILAITTVDSAYLTLWELSSRKIDRLDCSSGSKENPCFLCWSDEHSLLAIGSNKGNLLLYDHQTSKKVPILGKHQRSIISGCFTVDNLLVLSSEDSSISVSNIDGENLACLICNAPAEMIKSHRFKKLRDENQPREANDNDTELFISGVIGGKSIILLSSNDFENPINLQFQQKYGEITSYLWFVDGCIVIGFSNGFIVCISAQPTEIGQELYVIQEFKSSLSFICLNSATNELLSIGDSQLKIRSVDNIGEVTNIQELDFDTKGLSKIDTNYDGQFIYVTGQNGGVIVSLLKLPVIGAACKDCSVILSSLTEVTVQFNTNSSGDVIKFPIKFEPTFMAISSKYIAVALNNRVWFYTYNKKGGELKSEYEYISSIVQIKINDEFAAAMLSGGRVQLHKIFPDSTLSDAKNQSLIFPDCFDDNIKRIKKESDLKIECIDLSNRFLIYATTYYEIKHFSLREWVIVNEYKHNCSIKWISGENDGVRVCFFDDKMETFLYSPLDNKLISFNTTSSLKANFKYCLWEHFTIDKDSLVTHDDYTFFIYIIDRKRPTGYQLTYINSQKVPYRVSPLLLNKGVVTCLTATGKISSVLLESFKMDMMWDKKSIPEIEKILEQALILKRWSNAWRLCEKLSMKKHWHAFGRSTLKDLNVEIDRDNKSIIATRLLTGECFELLPYHNPIVGFLTMTRKTLRKIINKPSYFIYITDYCLKIYQHIGEVAYVWALEELIYVEEKSLLSGCLHQIIGEFDKAEEEFLQSSKPIKALDMRRDLLHWEKALSLADRLSPEDVPIISKEYAQQLEFMGNYREALKYYEKGLFEESSETTEEQYEHNEICNSGIARTSLKTGDFKKGITLASQIPIRSLKKECAMILEQQKQYFEAAALYELGNFYDRAAAISLKTKNYAKLTELLKYVRSPKIHSQFGKVMENEGKYKSAVESYLNGNDYDNAVRIYLDNLNDPQSAVKIVKESRSIEGAKMVSKFFCSINDKKSAIQFLVFSQCFKEAFQLAENENLIEIYEEILNSYGTNVQFNQMAEYYQEKKNWTKSGKFYYLGGNYSQALEYLLRKGNKEDALLIAIECVAASKDSELQNILLQHLMDDNGGMPKDPKLIFKFYISMSKYKEAAKVAVIISDNEQVKGNYRIARDLLFQMTQELFKNNIEMPNTIKLSLVLVHSYLLVKPLMATKRPEIAGRLLIRILQNISKFPSHKIQILTSAVVVCAQAMLFETAYNAAVELMKPENRKFIDEKYKKKIEQVARKRENASKGDIDEKFTNCPFCNEPVKEYDLTCFSCKMTLPFCIITGRHIVKDDLAICKNCTFPGFASEFNRLTVKICPMCGGNVSNYEIIDDIQKLEFHTKNEN